MASIEQRVVVLERRLAELERIAHTHAQMPWLKPVGPVFPVPPSDCTCPQNTACGNVACPRRQHVTCTVPDAGVGRE
jgi:hypothetical protein